jgi:rhodanese-related sulfurtransferase
MDTASFCLEPTEFLRLLQSLQPPWVLDIRRPAAFDASSHMIAGAQRCLPENIGAFARSMPAREVLVYCVYGHQVSQTAAAQLRDLGWDAKYLRGGMLGGEDGVDDPQQIAVWRATRLPMQAKSA